MSDKTNQTKLWGGRFAQGTDPRVDRLQASIGFDQRMAGEDIAVNLAHGRMLNRIGLLKDEEWEHIREGLERIRARVEAGKLEFQTELEDVHMNIEAALTELIGPVGAKIHTARSRNDQVAADFRLFVRNACDRLRERLLALRRVLVDLAGDNLDTILPGYTHLQRAQPVRLALHLLAYDQMVKRDLARFARARDAANQNPLGAAALAGTTFEVDREMTAEELGFDSVMENSMDAVADRDFVLDFMHAASVLMIHLSRLAEELILWSSQEYGFIELADAFTTGSSIMPQKKNPDVAELIRGKTGRVVGHHMSLLTTLKGLPMTYNKDLQEDKEPLFDVLDTLDLILDVLPDMLLSMIVNRERMRAACGRGFLEATDLADWLAAHGVPFREAHHQVGSLVKYCVAQGKSLTGLSLEEIKAHCPKAEGEVIPYLDLEKVVDRRTSQGGTARSEVEKLLAKAKREVEREKIATV